MPSEEVGIIGTLTPREREVLMLIAEGCTNQEIADRLGVDENTVRNGHAKSIYAKLSLRNRTQAAVYVWRQRLACAQAETAALRKQISDLQPELRALSFYFRKALASMENLGT